jgi:import inner membrane translocase subunit TIM44
LQIVASIKENPKLRAAAEEMKRQGLRISDGVTEAMQAVEESEFMRQLTKTSAAISQGVSTVTAPVRNTAAYKALSESVVEAFEESSRYGGYEEKEIRRKRREERLRKAGLSGKRKRVEANPEAGEALVLSETQEAEDGWRSKLKQTEAYQRWQETYYESENPVVSTLRSVTTTVGGWFEENETARVIRMIRRLDPDFQMESFQRELREYIVPEVVDAYLNADKESLKMWCGEAVSRYHSRCVSL